MSYERYMRVALSLARRQLGRTWPNPSVGAIIVKNEQIISVGATANGGRPHAETIAILDAGEAAKDATLYVTLEPCSHHGKTPPCVNAIIDAGISIVVIACRDRNPEVNRAGIVALKNVGITVIENICEREAIEINRGFFSVIEKKRPLVTLKIATSLDGKIAFPSTCHSAPVADSTDTDCNSRPRNKCGVTERGKIRWLTGEPARNYGHLLRAQHDAILTGIGTVLADDPLLTCRLSGLENHSPIRVVLDRYNRISKEAKIMTIQDVAPTWVMQEKTVTEVLSRLTARGITSVLIEAGAKLTTAFLESGLVDKVYWFTAPITIGEEGLCVEHALELLASFKQIEHIAIGNNNLDIFECLQE